MPRLDSSTLRNWPLPATDTDSDKESRGHVLVIAGSAQIPGAAILAAIAALRAGAGKLTIATAASVAPALALAVPEARVIPVSETPAGGLRPHSASELFDCAAASSAILIGPGLLDAPASCEFVQNLLSHIDAIPVILDALAMDVVRYQYRFNQPLLLTPHAGEMAHLTGLSKEDVLAQPLTIATQTASRLNAVVSLKGASTFIVSPQGTAWHHRAANPGLATSGSGDVLVGIMVGLAARGAPLEQAAAWGVVLHALAGKRLSRRHGPLGFLAREVSAEIPAVLRQFGQRSFGRN